MREIANKSTFQQIKLVRKYLKLKVLEDNITFRKHEKARTHVYDIMRRTISAGESHSALMIGPRGSGKTTLINSVLNQLSNEVDLANDAIIVKLNGLVHHDEKISLKAITAQMQLENAIDGKVFGTFAEQLSYLLSCLTSGNDRQCRSMIFVLDEFDMFCHSGRTQTLLYNLFDITHAKQAPMCVMGITNRIDVMDLLEKRVKSRFSHRHIFIFPNDGSSPLENFKDIFSSLLSLPVVKHSKKRRKSSVHPEVQMEIDQDKSVSLPMAALDKCKVTPETFTALEPTFVEDWNAHIHSLSENEKVIDALEKFCYYNVNEQVFRNLMFTQICKLGPSKHYLESADFTQAIDNIVCPEYRIKLLQSLSILEFSLLIAMMHGSAIFDGQPLNFEMVLHRYTKFALANSTAQTVPRPVILKAFEHLQELELIVPVRGDHGTDVGGVQKEYRLHALSVPAVEIKEAAKGFKALPTEIMHWVNNEF
ncbi:origin recognition complex subunit 4 [Hyposmocoma kahamanoa]|uniref:origin recognition complex subunit 4 n=1 Tax=Hyposmocoma kahamanoa TaxID=1477025 RepID=UPI000E6D6736|nr:origin recognition complex subunit 4 [Hyposmocoma kahamanoa]